jgi:SAM-dependent MidA family methyltransferase
MNPLHRIIAEKIQKAGGRLPFADFMAEALYHPDLGYYNRPDMTIGEHGDFYTSPMIHPIFGQCLARQIHSLWAQLGSPDTFAIVEMGAGTGALARDLLTEWDRIQTQDVSLRYLIVEQSSVLQAKQQETAEEAACGRIAWHSDLKEMDGYGSLVGVIVSNELFDALPVHRLIVEDGLLQERFVAFDDSDGEGCFREITGPLSDERLADLLDPVVKEQLENGDRMEVCPAAGRVLTAMADALQRGFLITIDYGDRSPDVYWRSIRTGGIRCYYKQSLAADPYQRIGEQDITADVDFSFLERTGEQAGLTTVRFATQSEFLEKMGFLDKVTQLQRRAFQDLRADFELQKMLTLYLPQGLGDACKVLIQEKAGGPF